MDRRDNSSKLLSLRNLVILLATLIAVIFFSKMFSDTENSVRKLEREIVQMKKECTAATEVRKESEDKNFAESIKKSSIIERLEEKVSNLESENKRLSETIREDKSLLALNKDEVLGITETIKSERDALRIEVESLRKGHVGCTHRGIQLPCTGDCEWNSDQWKGDGPDICEFINLRNKENFIYRLGVHAHYVDNSGMLALSHADFLFIDYIFTSYPRANMTELGTASGISSLYFGMVTRMLGGTLETFDIYDIRDSRSKRGWLDNMKFIQEDILSNENKNVIRSLQTRGQVHAFMDNGHKIKEVNVYAKYLPKGSILTTHDWDTEISLKDITEQLKAHGFQMIHEKFAILLQSHTRAWIKTTKGVGEE